jgi:hypothetical protein
MPFDGVEPPFNYLAKFDQVIELMETPGQWVKHTYRTPNGRYCLKEALNVVGIAEVFEPIILKTAEEVTGREFCCIESFNDHPQTMRGDVIAVLHQTRTKVLAGKAALPGADATAPSVRWSPYAATDRSGWSGALWRKLFAWS